MFLKAIFGAALTVSTALQVQALRITYPTDKVHQIDINTPLMLSWNSNISDPEFVDIVIKYKKDLRLGNSISEMEGMLVPGEKVSTNGSVFLIYWNNWPYAVGMLCEIIIGNSTSQETIDHTDVFQLVNINPTSAYGRQSSTVPATTASPTNASSSTTSLQYPGYGGYSVSLPSFLELNSDMTKWACTQTSWEFSGQSPNIQSYLKTATDCEQYSSTTTDEDLTPTGSEPSTSTSSTSATVTPSILDTTASTKSTTTTRPPMTSAGSTTALPTQTSGSSANGQRSSGVVLVWVCGVALAVIMHRHQ